MSQVSPMRQPGHRVTFHADPLRELLADVFHDIEPRFELSESIQITLTDFSPDLLKLTLLFPATASFDGQRAPYVYDTYENFAYLLGKGYFNANDLGGDETMVWYIPKTAGGETDAESSFVEQLAKTILPDQQES